MLQEEVLIGIVGHDKRVVENPWADHAIKTTVLSGAQHGRLDKGIVRDFKPSVESIVGQLVVRGDVAVNLVVVGFHLPLNGQLLFSNLLVRSIYE